MARFWIPKKLDENGNLTLPTGSIKGLFNCLTSIGSYGLDFAFYECTGLTGDISFPNLTSINSYGLNDAFRECTGIAGEVNFPSLTSISEYGLNNTFRNCTGLTGNVNFPSLTSIDSNGLRYAFRNCTGIKEIHFRADAKSIVEKQADYSNKFGATNSTIYFDL